MGRDKKDLVEVVRCKDCVYCVPAYDDRNAIAYCLISKLAIPTNDELNRRFCWAGATETQ